MILLSVGTQLPFDRLVKTVDDWADSADRTDIVAQIGPSEYTARRMKCFQFLSPDEFRRLQGEARLMIAHAGMGSIVTAMEYGTPIIIMPRDHERGEHRNGHQLATAQRFLDTPGVYVAMNETELLARLEDIGSLEGASTVSDKAPEKFTGKLRAFIDGTPPSRRQWLHFGAR
ncbi:MAG: hypothetical protein DI547_13735 [Sphingobium sp.]|nr:MAG: hypothetical protein DI547_13735 [Sphingobium sp.]